jgi:hypothetical protein
MNVTHELIASLPRRIGKNASKPWTPLRIHVIMVSIDKIDAGI